jgi:hypothetical protein
LAHDDADRLVDNGPRLQRGPQILDLACLLGPAGGQSEHAGHGRRDTAGPAEPGIRERAGVRRVEVQRSDRPVADGQGHRQRRPDPRGGGASRELGPLIRLRGVLGAGDLPGAHCAQARPVRDCLLDQFHPGGQLVTPGDRRRDAADQQDDSARRFGAPLLAGRQHREIRQQLVDAKGFYRH